MAINIPIKTSGGAQAVDDLTKVGNAGRTALDRINQGTAPASAGLYAMNAASHELKNGLSTAGSEGLVFRERIGGMTVYLREQFKGLAEVMTAFFAAEKFGEFAKGAIEDAARFNELGIALDTLGKNTGYSSQYMNSLVGSMESMGISSVDARQQIAKMMESNIDLSKAIDLTTVAQNASIITGEGVKNTLDEIDIALQSGETRTLKHMGLNVDFAASEKSLADSLGVTVKQLSQQEIVGARVNAVMEASKNIAGTMAAAWDDPIQVMNRARKAFKNLTEEAAQAFQPSFIAGANAFAEAVDFSAKHIDDLVNGVKSLTAAVGTFVGIGVVSYLGQWAVGWYDVAVALNAGRAANIAAAEAQQAAAAVAADAAIAHETLAAAVLTEAKAYQADLTEMAIYGPARAAANIAVSEAAAAQAAAATAVTAASANQVIAADAVAAASARAGAGVGIFTAAAGGLKTALTGLWTLMGGWVGVVAAAVGGLYYFRDSEVEVMGKTVEMRDLYAAAWQYMKDTTTTVVGVIAGAFSPVTNAMSSMISSLKDDWNGFLSWAKDHPAILSIVTSATSILGKTWDTLTSLPGQIVDKIGSAFVSTASEIKLAREESEKFSDVWNKLLFSPHVPMAAQPSFSMIPDQPAAASPFVRPVDPAQENAALKETLSLEKELASLRSQESLLAAGQDPAQHQKLAALQQELLYNKELVKASQQQKDEWIQQAMAVDTLVEKVKVMKDTQSVNLNTAQLNLENDAMRGDANTVLFLSAAKDKLKLATMGVKDSIAQENIDAKTANDIAMESNYLIKDRQASVDDVAKINASMIIDDQARADAQLAIEDQLWQDKMAAMDKGSADYKAALAAHNADMLTKQTVINTADWTADVKQMDSIFKTGFEGMLTGAKGSWGTMVTNLRDTFKTQLVDQLYKMFANQFVMQIVASVVGITGSAVSGAAQAAGTSITTSAITSAGSSAAGSQIASHGISGAVGTSFGGYGGAAVGALGGAYAGYEAGGVRGAAIGTVAGYAGGAALTAGGAALAAGWGTAASAGAAWAGAASALAAIPVYGWVALAALAIFGSGSKQPSNFTALSSANLPAGTTTTLHGDSPNATTQAGATNLAQMAISLSQMITAATGATETLTSVYTQVGQRDRIAIDAGVPVSSAFNASNPNYKAYAPTDMAGAVQGLAQTLIGGLSGVSETIKTQLESVVGKIDFTNAQQASSDFGFAVSLLTGKLVDAGKPISQMQSSIDALKASFAASTAQATRLGLSTQVVADAQAAALKALTDGFNTSIQDQILAITDPMAAALKTEATSAAARLQEAIDGGANLVAVEQLTALERDQIIQKYAGQSTSALSTTAKSILDFVHQLTGTTSSPLATQTSLANAKDYYQTTLAKAQGGDTVAQSAVTQAFKDFIDLDQQMYASSSQYFTDFNSGIASLKMLANSLNVQGGTTSSGYTAAQQSAIDAINATVNYKAPTAPNVPTPSAPDKATAQSVTAAVNTADNTAKMVTQLNDVGAQLTRQTAITKDLTTQVASLQQTIAAQQTSLDRLTHRRRA